MLVFYFWSLIFSYGSLIYISRVSFGISIKGGGANAAFAPPRDGNPERNPGDAAVIVGLRGGKYYGSIFQVFCCTGSSSDANSSSNLPDRLIDSIKQCSTMTYPNLHALFRIALTLPITSCESERSFSQLKLIKTARRSTMSELRLSSLSLM